MVDSAMFYLIGTLYPLVARATYAALSFPHYPGEVGASDADDEAKAVAQQDVRGRDRGAARRLPRVLPRRQAVHRRGDALDRRHPPRRDARVPAGDRLRLPGVGEEYIAAIEEALGEAYSEPVADVRGYIEYVRSQAA